MSKKILGIIGGAGTAATDNFCSLLTKYTPANNDQEHLERFVHNNPKIPDRTIEIEKIIRKEISIFNSNVVHELIRSIKLLQLAGANLYTIPCNTIHYFLPEVLRQISSFDKKISFIHIVEEVAKYCQKNTLQKVGLLSTRGTVISQIYPTICNKFDIKVIVPKQKGMDNIMDAIYGYRKGKINGLGIKNSVEYHQSKRNKKLLLTVINELATKELDALIIGCTEISLCIHSSDLMINNLPDFPMLDATEILAKACIQALY